MKPMTTLAEEQSWFRTVSLMVLAAVAMAAALIYTRGVMIPFVLALFVSYIVSPLMEFMESRLRCPRGLSIVMALLVVLVVMTMFVLLIMTSARGLTESAHFYRERLASVAASVLSIFDLLEIDLGQATLLEGLKQFPILSMVGSTASSVVAFVSNGILVLIFVVFLLFGRSVRRREGIYQEINTKVRRYLITKFVTSATTGILVGLCLTVLDLDLALLFGVLAFFLNFIPSVGSIISTLLPLPLAIVQFNSWIPIILVIALPGAVQMVIGNIIEPKILGEGLDLHPVTVLFALVFWGLIWGLVGMLLATPITAMVRIVLDRFETTRFIAEIMTGRLPAAGKISY